MGQVPTDVTPELRHVYVRAGVLTAQEAATLGFSVLQPLNTFGEVVMPSCTLQVQSQDHQHEVVCQRTGHEELRAAGVPRADIKRSAGGARALKDAVGDPHLPVCLHRRGAYGVLQVQCSSRQIATFPLGISHCRHRCVGGTTVNQGLPRRRK